MDTEVENRGPPGSDRACLPDHYGTYPLHVLTHKYIYTHRHTHTSTFPFCHSGRHSVQLMRGMREEEKAISPLIWTEYHVALGLAKSNHCTPCLTDSTHTQSALIWWMTLPVHSACWAVNLHVCASVGVCKNSCSPHVCHSGVYLQMPLLQLGLIPTFQGCFIIDELPGLSRAIALTHTHNQPQ